MTALADQPASLYYSLSSLMKIYTILTPLAVVLTWGFSSVHVHTETSACVSWPSSSWSYAFAS